MRRTVISLAALCAVAAWAWSLAGCDLIKSATNEKMLVATVMTTPAYDFCNVLLDQIPDGGLPPLPLDGGVDAGFLDLPDGGSLCRVPSKMVAEAFYAKRGEKDGISGAQVTLTLGGVDHAMPEKTDKAGSYGFIADVDYAASTPIKVTVFEGGQEYTATVNTPTVEYVNEFHDHPVPLVIDRGTEMRFTRRSSDTMVFANVGGFSLRGVDSAPTFTSLPKDAIGWADIALNPDSHKLRYVDIPGTGFPDGNTYYLVAVTGVERGKVSDNLFMTSTFIVGISDVGLVKTR